MRRFAIELCTDGFRSVNGNNVDLAGSAERGWGTCKGPVGEVAQKTIDLESKRVKVAAVSSQGTAKRSD